jgi:hypothetical protein
MRSTGDEGLGDAAEFPVIVGERRRSGAFARIALGALVLAGLLGAVSYISVVVSSGEINPGKARLDTHGYVSREAVGCATENQLYRYYQEGEKNGDLAAMLAVGGGCRVIEQGAAYSLVDGGFFLSRIVVPVTGGAQTPLWVTNASLR